jgi:uncharacterized glyoxalase superfamily protein PhnB
MKILRTTPLLVVDAIEPHLALWRDQLGYAVLVEVPEGDVLGFALLARDDQHLMLQTQHSLEKDIPAVAALHPASLLYTDVDNLSDLQAAMGGAEILVPLRTTFYGSREVFYRTSSGHIAAFAEPAPG